MLRPKLWPMEVAHALKRLPQWFELMYPKPAQPSLRMNKIEELLGMREEQAFVSPYERERKKKSQLVGWAWIQKNPGKWNPDTAQIASSGKSSSRRRDMNIATINESA
jgi:hypothetical protein